MQALKATPSRPSLFREPAHFLPSIHGAPRYSNGWVVPLPSDMLTPSKRHVPG